jgi:YD repeat-containing protein
LIAPGNVQAAVLTEQGTASWMVTFQNGEKRVFNNSSPVANNSNGGPLSAIVDRNGNTTTLTYDANDRLATVTDPAGRHLNFTYGGDNQFLVSSVTSDPGSGINLTYSYVESHSIFGDYPLLTQVNQADNTFVGFAYNSLLGITAVTDMNSKVLESHNYDSCSGGLSSSRANGVENLSISYSDAPSCGGGLGVP